MKNYQFNIMKSFIIVALLCLTQLVFGQIDSATIEKWYKENLSSYIPMTSRLNPINGIEWCDCEKDSSVIYFYKLWSHPLLSDSTGALYPSHQIFVFESSMPQITVYENFKNRITTPKSNWSTFNQTLDSIDIGTLPKILFELRYTVLGSPGGSMYMLRICQNGMPKNLILFENFELVTSSGMDMNAYRESGQKIMRIRRLFKLFLSDLK